MPRYLIEYYPDYNDWHIIHGDAFMETIEEPIVVPSEEYYCLTLVLDRDNLVDAVRDAEKKMGDYLKLQEKAVL